MAGYRQTLPRVWAYALACTSSDARRESLPLWVTHHNGVPGCRGGREDQATRTAPGVLGVLRDLRGVSVRWVSRA